MAFRLPVAVCLTLLIGRLHSLHIGTSSGGAGGYGGYGAASHGLGGGLYGAGYGGGLSGFGAGGAVGGYSNYLDNSALGRFFSAAGIRMPGLNANLASPAAFNFGPQRQGMYGLGFPAGGYAGAPAYGGSVYGTPSYGISPGLYGGNAGVYGGNAGVYGGNAGVYGGGDIGLGDSFYGGGVGDATYGLGNGLGATYGATDLGATDLGATDIGASVPATYGATDLGATGLGATGLGATGLGATGLGDLGLADGTYRNDIPTEVYDVNGNLVRTIPAGGATAGAVYRSPVSSSRPASFSTTNGVTSVYSSTSRFSDRTGVPGTTSTDARSYVVPAEPSDPLPLAGSYQRNPTIGNADVYSPATYGSNSVVGGVTNSNIRPNVYSGTGSSTGDYDSTSLATGPAPLYNTQLSQFPNSALQYTGNNNLNFPNIPSLGTILNRASVAADPLLRGGSIAGNNPTYSRLLGSAINAGVYGPNPGQLLPRASTLGQGLSTQVQGLVGPQQPRALQTNVPVVNSQQTGDKVAVDVGVVDGGATVVNQGVGMYTSNVGATGQTAAGVLVQPTGGATVVGRGAVISQSVGAGPAAIQNVAIPGTAATFGFSADGFYYDNVRSQPAPLVVGYLSHGFRKSCGSFYYDPRYQGCCDGTTYSYGTHKCCPGFGVYSKSNQQCMNGALQEYPVSYQPTCSGNPYDFRSQGCCGGSVYSYDGFECCGGNTIYHIGDSVCDGVQLYTINSNAYSQFYDLPFYRDYAMGGNQYKLSPNTPDNFFAPVCGTSQFIGFASGCCDGNVYKYGTELCCHGNNDVGVHQYFVSTVENGCGNNAVNYYGDYYSVAKKM